MVKKFGEAYHDYMRHTGRFFPRLVGNLPYEIRPQYEQSATIEVAIDHEWVFTTLLIGVVVFVVLAVTIW